MGGRKLTKKRQKLYEKCHQELLLAKQDCLNLLAQSKEGLGSEISGDEGDMSTAITERNFSLAKREAAEKKLREILAALERCEEDTYGICEETGDEIEEKRLLAIPWTRFSVEGAEMQERSGRRYMNSTNDDDIEFDMGS